MKIIAAIQVDMEVTSLGTRSRLADDMAGKSVLRRTLDRVARIQHVDAIHLLCPANQVHACKCIVDRTQAVVEPFDLPPPSWAPLVQAARKWSLDGWRGGLGGSSYFDEFTDPRLLDGLAKKTGADLVLSVPAAAVVFDPALADSMIDYYHAKSDDSKLTFAPTPPGLTGIVLDRTMLQELATANVPLGWVFSYKPDSPQKDLIFQPCCYEVPADLRFSYGRLLADTDRAVARLDELLAEYPDPDAKTVGHWLRRREQNLTDPLPRELEIELTTDDPFPHGLLRPRGEAVEPRGPIDPDLVGRIVQELRRFDDSLLILAGFGDPLRHPKFSDVLLAIRSASGGDHPLYGLAIRTPAVDLGDPQIEAIIEHGVDVLEVSLDAWTPQTYAKVQTPVNGSDADLSKTLKNLDRLAELRPRDKTVKPILVPELTKARQNVHELDDFHDGWLRKLGAVAITGYSHYGGRRPDHSVIQMAPSPRTPCQRINSRCVILADGRVTLCDQDINGVHAVGCVGEASLEALWKSAQFASIREAHAREQFDATQLCAACEEWHRP